jgi:hypothetical protein
MEMPAFCFAAGDAAPNVGLPRAATANGSAMSYQIGWDTLNLRPAPRLAHTEYCDHAELIRRVTGEQDAHKRGRAFCDAWAIDLVWMTNDGPVGWDKRGRVTDMGHAEYVEGGTDKRLPRQSPFRDQEDVLAFDAVKEYGLPDDDELVAFYEKLYREGQAARPEQVYPGGYYKTIVSGAIQAFGWEMLLLGAAEPARFEKVLDSFFRLSLHHFRAWAKTSIKAFICHDDMVWTAGPFMNPTFYRRVIFPRYKELWAPLRQAGKKVLYCSDGDYSMFVDDIAQAGAHGFIFEPLTKLEPIVRKYGQSHVIVGSDVDCRTLTFGTREQIRAEIDATLKLALPCPGFMFAVGNHLPANIPIGNLEFYFEHLRAHWFR